MNDIINTCLKNGYDLFFFGKPNAQLQLYKKNSKKPIAVICGNSPYKDEKMKGLFDKSHFYRKSDFNEFIKIFEEK